MTYVLTISLLIYGFDKVKTTSNNYLEPLTNFSIIIPFRNEGKDILNLLNSISKMDYPKNLFKFVVVNDDSNDDSVVIFKKWHA